MSYRCDAGMRRRARRAIPVIVLAAACQDLFSADGTCNGPNDLELCLERLEYAGPVDVDLEVRNRGSATVWVDDCSVYLAGDPLAPENIQPVFDPTRRCTPGSDDVPSLIPVGPGGSGTVRVFLGAGSQGFRRIFVWVSRDGDVVADDPVGSPVFRSVPSAG